MLAFLLACLSTQSVPAETANDLCGATITANLKLDHDLTCTGDGLIVGADGIKINLNGHTISGAGMGVGISLVGRTRVSIVAGTLQNFAVAVRMNSSTNVAIKENIFRENAEGLDLQSGSVGNTIKENEFWNSSVRAIMLRSFATNNVVKENTFNGNRIGILVFGGVNNILKENVISASIVAGIRLSVIARGNVILENTIVSNAVGIEFVVTPTGSSMGNTFLENRIATNDCGLKGPAAGNTFSENVFEGNAVDSCPAS
jgi:parallel beta-helix repeat protein